MAELNHSICNNCINRFVLSTEDKELLRIALTLHYLKEAEVIGFCIRDPHLSGTFIDRILFGNYPLKKCNFKTTGNNIFRTPYKCPVCKKSLFVVNDDGNKSFFCPNCGKKHHSIVINTTCRFCGTPLVLYSGHIFKCECKNCGRLVSIPVLPQVYPSINPREELCAHGRIIEDCASCLKSRTNRTNILIEETCLAITKQRNNSRQSRERYQKQNSKYKDSMADYHEDDLNNFKDDDHKLDSKYNLKNQSADWSDNYDDIEDWTDNEESDDDWY